ncbi:MAG: DUF1634 domain-containing protein [Pseudobdellovibrionaceae bacterium]
MTSNLELRIAKLLRWGVIGAEALLILGWLSFFDISKNPLLQFHDYSEESLSKSLETAVQNQQWGVLAAYAGLALLISLPISRVLMTGILFTKQRDRLLAIASFFVFGTIIFSFILGFEL